MTRTHSSVAGFFNEWNVYGLYFTRTAHAKPEKTFRERTIYIHKRVVYLMPYNYFEYCIRARIRFKCYNSQITIGMDYFRVCYKQHTLSVGVPIRNLVNRRNVCTHVVFYCCALFYTALYILVYTVAETCKWRDLKRLPRKTPKLKQIISTRPFHCSSASPRQILMTTPCIVRITFVISLLINGKKT